MHPDNRKLAKELIAKKAQKDVKPEPRKIVLSQREIGQLSMDYKLPEPARL